MRIAIDATSVLKPHRTGIARYVVNLVSSLAREAADEEFVLCYRFSRFRKRRHRLQLPTSRFRQAFIQGRIHPRGVDVTHGPDGRLLDFRGAKKVVTVHDLFSLESDEFSTHTFRKRKEQRYQEIARQAHRILCVSSWTRDTFWRHYQVEEERFHVVPEGVEDRFTPAAGEWVSSIRARHGIHGPYVLFVGQLSVRKNIRGMLDAFSMMTADDPMLVLAGSPSHGHEDLEAEILKRGLSDRVMMTGFFPDSELPVLMTGAECLLFPSFLEGYGLPVLEAMACGTPVVCSDRGALPETTAEICVTVDPEDPDSIRDGVQRLLSDDDLREDLIRRGLQWAGHNTWARVAQRTLAVYREMAE